MFDEEGNLTTIKGFLMDITQQKKLEEQLLQARKLESLGSMAGGIAHDFNNLLTPIIGHVGVVLMETPADHPWHKNLEAINNSALRAKDLVGQILTFSRHRKGKLERMNLAPIVTEVFRLIHPVTASGITLKEKINAHCRAIKGDPTQMHQIVMNLMTNACHAMEETGGELSVTLEEMQVNPNTPPIPPGVPPGEWVCLTVTDTGVGIARKILDKIFEPFFTTREKGKGTGMGLSVVHGIVKNMGGIITVDSTPGIGTRFALFFPAAPLPQARASSELKKPIQPVCPPEE